MRLDFNVLWVDDQPSRINAQISAIKRRMEHDGFNFVPTLLQTMGEIQSAISENVFFDEVDLILVDWDLGDEIRGQDVIAKIREDIPYKDVVFYSAQTAPDLRRAVFEKNLEGVYCANREHLVEEVMGVFESLVKKVLDLDHTRGIVMGATSDIDHIVNQCLRAAHGQADKGGKDQIIAQALKNVQKRISDLSKKTERLKEATELGDFFESHMIFTSFDRLRILSRCLKQGGTLAAHSRYRDAVVQYQNDVLPIRNKLGHMVLLPQAKSLAVVDDEGNEVTVTKMRELRCLLLDLRSQFRDLLEVVESQAGAMDNLQSAAVDIAEQLD